MIGLLILAAVASTSPSRGTQNAGFCNGPIFAQSDLNFCADADFKSADTEMNAQWKKTAAAYRQVDAAHKKDGLVPTEAFDHLLRGQRAWLTYREETCQAVYLSTGGSIAPMNYSACMAEMTRIRTKELFQLSRSPNSDEPL